MFTQHWGTHGFRRCSLKAGLVVAMMLTGVLLFPSSAAAQESPTGCNANEFDVTLVANTLAAVAGDTVTYRVLLENTGLQAGCDVTDVDLVFICPDGTTTPVVTDAAYPFPTGIQLVGTFNCVVPSGVDFAVAEVKGDFLLMGPTPTPNTVSKTLSLTVQDCLVQVDKQVSCDGGVTWFDQGLVSSNEDGTFSCNGVNDTAPAIQVRYEVKNTGQTQLFACTLDDTNNAFDLDADGVLITSPLTIGGTTGLVAAPGQPLCSDSLDANEPNTASVNCFCTSGLDPELKTSASDSANINCQSTSNLTVVKECPDANSDGTDEIAITVSASAADLGFTSCTVSDSIFLDDPTCPANVGGGTPVAVAPASFALAAGGSQVVTGEIALSADACNTVSVTCTQAGTGATVTATDDTVCPGAGEGCVTRTPGFWGNHPAITAQFLPVEICGVSLDTTAASDDSSATEAICSVGRDGKILGPQLTQLVRQCTAAALNIAASVEGGGNCSTNFPNLTEQFASCCGDQSICTGDAVEDFTITSCIETLDAFNNSIDTLEPFGPFISPGPADSSICRDARNNGKVVTPVP